MYRVLPETDLEKRLISMGAMFIEENNVLSELEQVFGEDLADEDYCRDHQQEIISELGEYFFRLDMNYGAAARLSCVEILQDFWKVGSADEVKSVLQEIRNQGHRTKFNVLKGALPQEGSLDMQSLEKFSQIFKFDFTDHEVSLNKDEISSLAKWVQSTGQYLGERSILAWDMARAVQLIKLAFVAGYLDDNEAWAELLKLAPLTEGKFKDWMGFSQSFLMGRTFWSGVSDPQIKSVCERLLGHPASPWLYIHWDENSDDLHTD